MSICGLLKCLLFFWELNLNLRYFFSCSVDLILLRIIASTRENNQARFKVDSKYIYAFQNKISPNSNNKQMRIITQKGWLY